MKFLKRLNEKQVVLISGASGMGKSTLAQNYGISKKQENLQVRWIKGRQIDGEFFKLAKALKIPTEGLSCGEIRDLVYGRLERMTKDQVFLIFDNVEDKEKIKQYLKNLPNNLKIIITSKNSKLLDDVEPIEIKGFKKQEAIIYLRSALGKNEDDAKKLVEVVGKSPFRLSKTVGYFQKHNMKSVQDYVNNYEAIKAGCNQDEEIYPEIEMLFGNLKTQSSESWMALKYLAYLDPEGVPAKSIQTLMKKTTNEMEEIINQLRPLSLVDVVTQGDEIVLKISHRIIQEETRKALIAEDSTQASKIIEKLVDKLNGLLPTFDENDKNTEKVFALVNHAEMLIKEGQAEKIHCEALTDLLSKLGSYYFYLIFDYSKAIVYWQNLLDEQKIIDQKSLIDLAKTRNDIGHAYLKLGGTKNLNEALVYLNESLEIRETLFSNDHLDKATTLNNIGLCYQKLGGASNLSKALSYYESSLAMRRNLFIGNHTKIAIVLNNIGLTYCELGGAENYDQAFKYFKEGLEMRKALLPGNHPDVALSLNSLGVAYYELGCQKKGDQKNLKEALFYMESALKMRQALFPEKHPSVVVSLNNVGLCYQKLGGNENLKKGLSYFENSLKMTEELFSGNHFDVEVGILLNNIGKTYEALDGLDNIYKALDYEERSLIIFQKIFESNHPHIGHILYNIGKTYKKFDDQNKAIEYMKQAYSILFKKSGADHPKTKEIKADIESIDPNFFSGNQIGSECRQIISLRKGINKDLLILKKKIQKNVLNKVVKAVNDNGWSAPGRILKEWGVKGYVDKNYLKRQLRELGNDENNIESAQMLCFKSMNLGIMKSENKPYKTVMAFTQDHFELIKKIAVEHPEFFVDGSIVEACVRAMPEDKAFEEHILKHVKYMGMESRKERDQTK